MATLTRTIDFTRGKLSHADLDTEFNNYLNFINSFCLTSPASGAFNFNNQLLLNPRFRKFWNIVDATEFNTIQDAIDDITAGIVLIPANNTFTITASQVLTLKTGVYLVGQGWTSVLRKDTTWDESDAAQLINIPGTATDCGVMNLKIDGREDPNDAASGDGVNAITVRGDRVHIDKVWVDGWGADADDIDMRNDGVFLGQNDTGTELATDVWVTNCRFSNIRRNGVGGVHTENVFIHNNRFDDCTNAAVDLEPNQAASHVLNSIVSDNVITNCLIGIVVDGHDTETGGVPGGTGDALRAIVHGNLIHGCSSQGIVIYRYADVHVRNNTVSSCASTNSAHGIEIRDCQIVGVTGNTIRNHGTGSSTTSDGITVGATQIVDGGNNEESFYIDVSGNILQTIARHGISVSSGTSAGASNYIKVSGNIIRNPAVHNSTTADGIFTEESHVSVLNNIIRGDGVAMQYGVNFSGSISNCILVGNRITGWATEAVNRSTINNLTEGHNHEE